MLDDMLALANSVCLLALSRSGRRVLALLLCTGLIAPYCAVCGIGARRLRARTCGKNLDENKSLGKEGCYSINKRERKKKKRARRHVIERVAQMGALRRQRGANRACCGKRQKYGSLYLHVIRFLIRLDELLKPNNGRSAMGWRGQL